MSFNSRELRTLRVANRLIGAGHPVFVIAEIGYNFTTLDEARWSIDAALDAGADAVKIQTFRAETVVSRVAAFPTQAGSGNQYEEFERFQISPQVHEAIFEHARQRDAIMFSTPSYYDDVDLLERLGTPVHKIGSDDLTNLPFLRYVADTGKPIIFSTGMATIAEVAEAFEAVTAGGNTQVAILHCVSNYPLTDLSMLNLRSLQTLAAMFGVPVGLSDHTTGVSAAAAAVALGASIVERHFTIDKGLDVPDAAFSADPREFADLVRTIREVEQALGDGLKRPAATELEMRTETRKSVFARCAIAAGEVIPAEKLIIKRPASGIPPKLASLVAGRRARRAIAADNPITWDVLD